MKNLKDCMVSSEFYHFGILPDVTIHYPIGDKYSHMYEPQLICECGCSEWVESDAYLFESLDGDKFPSLRVHKCKNCDKIRIAHHRGLKEASE